MGEAKRRAARGAGGCEGCTLCCKVLRISDGGLEKAAYEVCGHCWPGGCGIYASRPGVCRGFECLWKGHDLFRGPEWFPGRCGMLAHIPPERIDPEAGTFEVHVRVDEGREGAWREEPYLGTLRRLVGDRSLVIDHGSLSLLGVRVLVCERERSWWVLSEAIIENPGEGWMVLVGPDGHEVVPDVE